MVCASIHTGFHLSRVTRGSSRLQSSFVYGAITLFGRLFQGVHLPERILLRSTFYCALLAVLRPTPPRGKPLDFGLFRFRSPLLTESHSLSFPPLTEMFHFSGCRSTWTMNSSRSHWVHQWGFPIRRSSGVVMTASVFPGLIAGNRVLHRLPAPRHSPRALSSLSKCINLP